MTIRFTKMHGLGNDYLFIDAMEAADLAARDDWAVLVPAMCDRRLGAGADGVILLQAADDRAHDARMRIWNSDGSEAEMCGNGLRCAAKLLIERGHIVPRDDGAIRVLAGGRTLRVWTHGPTMMRIGSATIEIGRARFGAEAVGARTDLLGPGSREGTVVFEVPGSGRVEGVPVDVGNPHLVVFLDHSPDEVDLPSLGPAIERHGAFPARINAHVAQVRGRGSIAMRSWERGAGMTSACGTGATAVFAAARLLGLVDEAVDIDLPGGRLRLEEDRDGAIRMTGPAVEVYSADWRPPTLDSPWANIEIETDRLILRELREEDIPGFARAYNSPDFSRVTLTMPERYTSQSAARMLGRVRTAKGPWSSWTALDRESGQVILTLGLRLEPETKSAEIGYAVGREWWGRGYAQEAVRAVLRHAFTSLGLVRVMAKIFPWNPASENVVSKCGMTREGVLRNAAFKDGKAYDITQWSITREEWEARCAPRD